MTRRFRIVPEVHLVLTRGDARLMLLRAGTGYMDGYWGLVAGHVDGDETFREAMAREAAEEAGLTIAPAALELAHTMHRFDGQERLSLFFRAREWQGDPVNREPHKCAALEWHPRGCAPAPMIPYIAHALARIAAGEGYSEFGWPDDPECG